MRCRFCEGIAVKERNLIGTDWGGDGHFELGEPARLSPNRRRPWGVEATSLKCGEGHQTLNSQGR